MVTDAVDHLLGAGEIRRLAERLDLRPTKTLGQNFVHDANTVRRIVEISGVGSGDHVLEVGPGLGSLTLALLQTAGRVTAVEIDPRLAAALPATARDHLGAMADRLAVVRADALRIGYDDAPGLPTSATSADFSGGSAVPASSVPVPVTPTALVANLPYNVSVPVILHLLATFPTIVSMLVMVQSEVADRLVAAPGSRTYGGPSAKLAWYGPARRAGSVSRAIFWPVPGVDSALVSWTRADPPRPDVTAPAVFAAVDAAFAQRRKTLRSALSAWAGSPAAAETLCRAAGIDPTARGEVLPIGAFAALAAAREASADCGPAGADAVGTPGAYRGPTGAAGERGEA